MRLRIGEQYDEKGYITVAQDGSLTLEGDTAYLRGMLQAMRRTEWADVSDAELVASLPSRLDGFYTWAHDTDRDTDPDPGTLAYRQSLVQQTKGA